MEIKSKIRRICSSPSMIPDVKLFSFLERSLHVATFGMFPDALESRKRQYSSVSPTFLWEIRYITSFSHLRKMISCPFQ